MLRIIQGFEGTASLIAVRRRRKASFHQELCIGVNNLNFVELSYSTSYCKQRGACSAIESCPLFELIFLFSIISTGGIKSVRFSLYYLFKYSKFFEIRSHLCLTQSTERSGSDGVLNV